MARTKTLQPVCEDPEQIKQYLVVLKELEKRRRQVMKVQSTLRGQAGSLVFRCLGGYKSQGRTRPLRKLCLIGQQMLLRRLMLGTNVC